MIEYGKKKESWKEKEKMNKKVQIMGTKVKITNSDRKNKQLKALFPDGTIKYFGDPGMKEYPGTPRGDNYCARSYGIGKKYNILQDPKSPNTLSRKILWKCKGKKSQSTHRKAGVKIL